MEKNTSIFAIFLALASYSSSYGSNFIEDSAREKIIRKHGHYVIDTERAAKISCILSKGGTVKILVDGDVSLAKGTSISGAAGTLIIKCKGNFHGNNIPISADNIEIKANGCN